MAERKSKKARRTAEPSAALPVIRPAAKLPLKQSVVVAKFLFLDQTQSIIGVLAARLRAMHARAIITPFEIFRWAKDRHAKSAANSNTGTSITSHFLNWVVDRCQLMVRRGVSCAGDSHYVAQGSRP